MFRFALKNAFRRKNIAALSLIGVAIGVALMTTMTAIGASITTQANQFAQTNLESVTVQQKGQLFYNSKFNLSDAYNLTQVDHIEAWQAQVITQVSFPASPVSVSLVGVDAQNDTAMEGVTTKVVEGRLFQNDNECIVSKTAKNFIDLKLGDVISFLTPDTPPSVVNLTVVGFYESVSFFRITDVYTTIDTVRLFKSDFTNDTYSILLIKADGPDTVKLVEDEINQIIEEENLNLEIILFDEQLETINEFVGTMNILVFSISLIAGIAGGMSVIVAMTMSVIERMKEFATLKATGWQNRDVIKDIIYESIIITVIGGIVGFVIGILFINVMQFAFGVEMEALQLTVYLTIGLFVIGLGIVGGIYPAYKASKASPVEILRGE
ncbi:MAG: ABC transporter permease [Candidatus Odinarchaeia archaeon]